MERNGFFSLLSFAFIEIDPMCKVLVIQLDCDRRQSLCTLEILILRKLQLVFHCQSSSCIDEFFSGRKMPPGIDFEFKAHFKPYYAWNFLLKNARTITFNYGHSDEFLSVIAAKLPTYRPTVRRKSTKFQAFKLPRLMIDLEKTEIVLLPVSFSKKRKKNTTARNYLLFRIACSKIWIMNS